ncbi:MAG: amidohydrolase [Acidobacteriota bacterium]|nr:amidohydrolase [Acidobacteriota bacterium]
MKIIDTHQHLWDMDLFTFSWCKDVPLLNRSFRMPDYLDAIRGVGVEKSIHVEADVDEPCMLDETRHILKLAGDKDNPLAGVVACARPEKAGFKEYLDQIAGHPALKGIRRVLHTQPDATAKSETFVENIKILQEYKLSYDICVLARQLPIAIQLVQQCPDVTFILDHCGVPQVKERALEPWREHIREIAQFPNVSCKVSGIVAYADPQNWTPEDLRPFVHHVIESFGWNRVMFGSDWPVCTVSAPLRKWVEALAVLTRAGGEENQKKLFHDNAERIYRLS